MKRTMKIVHLSLAIAGFALVACSGGAEEAKAPAADPAIAEAQHRVRAMEDSLSDAAAFDRRRLMALRQPLPIGQPGTRHAT